MIHTVIQHPGNTPTQGSITVTLMGDSGTIKHVCSWNINPLNKIDTQKSFAEAVQLCNRLNGGIGLDAQTLLDIKELVKIGLAQARKELS